MNRKFKVYCSAPMKYIDVYETLKIELQESYLNNYFELRIPRMFDTDSYAFVDSDLFALQDCGILISHIPEPSVGSCAELGYFKALKPNNPIIAFQCINHPWIHRLSNYQVTKISEILDIFEVIVQAY